MSACVTEEEFDIDKPKYDLETYSGRAMYYFQTTNPLNLFAGERELERARCIVKKVRWVEKNLYNFGAFLIFFNWKIGLCNKNKLMR